MLENIQSLKLKFDALLRPDGVYVCDSLPSVVGCMLEGVPSHLIYSSIPEVEQFNAKVPECSSFATSQLRPLSFEWVMPDFYLNLDVYGYVLSKLDSVVSLGGYDTEVYYQRVCRELDYFEESNSLDFLRCIIYVIERMTMEDIFWGVGRGSSCASLVFFLIGLHKIDPIKYDICEKEFFKPFLDHK